MRHSWIKGLDRDTYTLVRRAFTAGYDSHRLQPDRLTENDLWELFVEREALNESKQPRKE